MQVNPARDSNATGHDTDSDSSAEGSDGDAVPVFEFESSAVKQKVRLWGIKQCVADLQDHAVTSDLRGAG